jgi:Ca2+/Na+ antiporter
MPEEYFINNIFDLFKNPLAFYPNNSQSLEQYLNSMIKLFMYVSLILVVSNNDLSYLYILVIVVLLCTVYYYKVSENNQIDNMNNIVKQPRTVPTINNPMMNITMADYLNLDKNGNIKPKPPILDPRDPEVKRQMNYALNYNKAGDYENLYADKISNRAWFTRPSTSIPDDQASFRAWVYNTKGTNCKTDSKCAKPFDVRSNRNGSVYTAKDGNLIKN